MTIVHDPPNTTMPCKVCDLRHYTCSRCGVDTTMGAPAGPHTVNTDGVGRCPPCAGRARTLTHRVEEALARIVTSPEVITLVNARLHDEFVKLQDEIANDDEMAGEGFWELMDPVVVEDRDVIVLDDDNHGDKVIVENGRFKLVRGDREEA